jgi:hypothetical protein
VVAIGRRGDLVEQRERLGGPALVAGQERGRDEEHRPLDAIGPCLVEQERRRSVPAAGLGVLPCSPKLITR